jgi:hypothetical protein
VEDGTLPGLVRAVAPLGGGLDGRFARDAVPRLIRAGQLDEARASLGLAHESTFASLVLTRLSPHLDAEERSRAVRAVWEMAREEMARGEMARAALSRGAGPRSSPASRSAGITWWRASSSVSLASIWTRPRSPPHAASNRRTRGFAGSTTIRPFTWTGPSGTSTSPTCRRWGARSRPDPFAHRGPSP